MPHPRSPAPNMQFVPVFVHPSFCFGVPNQPTAHRERRGKSWSQFLGLPLDQANGRVAKRFRKLPLLEPALERIRQTLGHVRLAAIKKNAGSRVPAVFSQNSSIKSGP